MSDFSKTLVKGFLKAKDTHMINGEAKKIILRGWGMGNWTNPEGFMIGAGDWTEGLSQDNKVAGRMDRYRTISGVIRELCGSAYEKSFWQQWHKNYLSEADIRALSEAGYNSVRLPLNSAVFLAEEPGYHWNETAFLMLTDVLKWCETYKVYAILDLHAAVAGQSCLPCDDGVDNTPHLFIDEESGERTIRLWEELARRYKDFWIVGGYDLLNEPLSLPRWDYLLPELEKFYDDCIARIRAIDTQHMIILEGHRFASRMDVFTKEFDPTCHNWAIQIHCYNAAPEMRTLQAALAKSNELKVPIWLGETGGSNEWMTTLYEMGIQHQIGFNVWCWKSAGGATSAAIFKSPKEWSLVTDYASRGGKKPSFARSQEIFNELLENIRYENCRLNDQVHAYLLRQPGIEIPAVSYDAYPGKDYSFKGKNPYGNPYNYREADGMYIVGTEKSVIIEMSDFMEMTRAYQPELNVFGNWQTLALKLTVSEYVQYTIRDVLSEKNVLITYKTDKTTQLQMTVCGQVFYTILHPTDDFVEIKVGTISPISEAHIQLSVAGELILKTISVR